MLSGSVWGVIAVAVVYWTMYAIMRWTQSRKEPRLLPTGIPFLDPVLGIATQKVKYLVNIRTKYRLPILTLRMPFQKIYVVNAPDLIQAVQAKINLPNFVPNLLDFGMLFSGLNKESKRQLVDGFGIHGNGFTKSVHKYLTSGPMLQVATRTAIDKLAASIPNNFSNGEARTRGLLETIRHDLTLAMTGAIYGLENPYDDPEIEASWLAFVPGISHLLYSPFPQVTARKALRARTRIHDAFTEYFETGGHLQAFPMIPEMYNINKSHGLSSTEAAKLEMATSLAMLSSGAITTFWLLFHILSSQSLLEQVCTELLNHTTKITASHDGKTVKVVDASLIKTSCPTLMAALHETLRYHSTVINIKKVQHDTVLASQYALKKNAILMIPGTAVHHDTDIWGSTSTTFDHTRFLSPEGVKKASSTSAFRPFGAGATMCPGRNFSINVMLGLVAMVVLQFDVTSVDGGRGAERAEWEMPSKKNADLWNAMPKPDWDIPVRILPRQVEGVEWKFVWGGAVAADQGKDEQKEHKI